MEKIKMLMAHKVFKVFKWVFLIVLVFYFILVAIRVVHFFNQDKIDAAVAKIHSTKLTLDDVMGKNLPPDPGAEANKTVEGVDTNENGIRDDVELAIFKEYPNSAKTRAVLLQYALAMQMEFIQPIFEEEIVIAVSQEGDRAFYCIGEILFRDEKDEKIMDNYFKDADKLTNFVEDRQLNTEARIQAEKDFLKKIGSYNSLDYFCDIDYSKLPN